MALAHKSRRQAEPGRHERLVPLGMTKWRRPDDPERAVPSRTLSLAFVVISLRARRRRASEADMKRSM